METKKKLREYLTKGVRKIKHRKGFGVHSPFAYTIITEVIEEKVPYYAYTTLKKHYTSTTPIQLKTASLLLRLANRFSCRHILEIESDGGYSALPLMLVDSRNDILVESDDPTYQQAQHLMHHVEAERLAQMRHIADLRDLATDYTADMMIINGRPAGMSDADLFAWIQAHSTETTIYWVRDITAARPLEELWDLFCDCDDIAITMDLYNYGLAIRKPRFFKQHYVVSF